MIVVYGEISFGQNTAGYFHLGQPAELNRLGALSVALPTSSAVLFRYRIRRLDSTLENVECSHALGAQTGFGDPGVVSSFFTPITLYTGDVLLASCDSIESGCLIKLSLELS